MKSELKRDHGTIRKVKDLFVTAAHTTSVAKFTEAMAALNTICAEAYTCLTTLGVQTWAISRVPFNPLGNLASNDVGEFNWFFRA
jgi:hypothetical protein